jgi:hypothetical protein
MHSEVEAWLNSKLGQVGLELDTATETKALLDLQARYGHQEEQVRAFFAKGVSDYVAEVEGFYMTHGLDTRKLRAKVALALSGLTHADGTLYGSEVREKLKEIDAGKVETARKLIEEKKQVHRQATQAFIRAKDGITQQVIQEEVEKLAAEVKALEVEAVPYLERYKDKLAELAAFRVRLRGLLKAVEESEQDVRAQRLHEAVERIELAFLPKQKWERLRLDTARCRIIFSRTFDAIDPSA